MKIFTFLQHRATSCLDEHNCVTHTTGSISTKSQRVGWRNWFEHFWSFFN
jgi:hypothetical protein